MPCDDEASRGDEVSRGDEAKQEEGASSGGCEKRVGVGVLLKMELGR